MTRAPHPIGLAGLLAGRTRRARRATVPAAAAREGFRWGWRDQRTRRWWPQGIDVRPEPGGDGASGMLAVVSWYLRRDGAEAGTRLTFVRVAPGRRPRYAHVVLVERAADGTLTPISVHAGGVAFAGERVLVADTFQGWRSFRLDDIARLPGWRRLLGARAVLVQEAAHPGAVDPGADGGRRMRHSFLSVEHAADGDRLVVGEYRGGTADGRLARLGLAPARLDAADQRAEWHAPQVPRMQGACLVDGVWAITTSEGVRRPGDLWVGPVDALVRHRGVLPPGPEDIAHLPGTRMLWSLSEHPGRRWVYRLDLDDWTTLDDGTATG
jgi:hypothetical protein